jgi:hypothetical protein
MTDNALRIIRELTDSHLSVSVAQISESDDLNESLTSEEREILNDGAPPTDDERFSRVRLEEAQRLSRIAQS